MFNLQYTFSWDQHNYETTNSTIKAKLMYRANRNKRCLLIAAAVESWNNNQTEMKHRPLKGLSPNKLKSLIPDIYLKPHQVRVFNSSCKIIYTVISKLFLLQLTIL